MSGTSEGINRGIDDISTLRQPETPIMEDIALDRKQGDENDSDRKYPTSLNLEFVYQSKQKQETRNKKHARSAFTTAKLRYLIAKDISRV
jgi:hypothetical protein